MNNNEQKAINLLGEIVKWWDEWISSDSPTEMENPPIEEAKELLAALGVQR
jgi:hypothetical protein